MPMIDNNLFLLGLNVNAVAIASGNFASLDMTSGEYVINGQPCSIDDVFNIGNSDPITAADIDAGGLRAKPGGGGNYGSRYTEFNPSLVATVIADGFTLVFDMFSSSEAQIGGIVYDEGYVDLSSFDIYGRTSPAAPQDVITALDTSTASFTDPLVPEARNKVALSWDQDYMSFSVNGRPVHRVNKAGINANSAIIAFVFGGVTITDPAIRLRRFDFFTLVPDANLPALTAL